ncbi:hypothetical protein GAGA_3031 [Paraglaciecola agarilytica NO2]|uniref:Uncharacterized protein n=1 Tax=Paraglaciecola agarilytica NO2 TaxID=1125747 RepID=A0ABQ0I945_9ALTE|nr:hypothetical protein GAGA_3031 [Paraglaciecola agarilytica NO2]
MLPPLGNFVRHGLLLLKLFIRYILQVLVETRYKVLIPLQRK